MEPGTAYAVYHTGIAQLLKTDGQATPSRLHYLFMRKWAARPDRADIEQCLAFMVRQDQVEQCGTKQTPIYGEEHLYRLKVLRKGYYLTKGGYQARLDEDIVIRGLGVVPEWGFVAYKSNGEFEFKDENYDPHPRDSVDLLIETWQPQPF